MSIVNYLFHHIKEVLYKLSVFCNIMHAMLFSLIYWKETNKVPDMMCALNG